MLVGKLTNSCTRCAARKVKCDRQQPCANCVKHSAECVSEPPRPPRRSRVKKQALIDQIKHYESLLKVRGLNPDKGSSTSEPLSHYSSDLQSTPTSVEETPLQPLNRVQSGTDQNINKSHVLHGQGRSRHVDNSLWSQVVEELDDPDYALDDSANDESDDDNDATDDGHDFVLQQRTSSANTKVHPPSADHGQFLWQIFKERIDPLTKIIHVPTVHPAMEKAIKTPASIPSSFKALMFAIYATAVMSLKDAECQSRLHETRKVAQSRYILATKKALARANFMSTINFAVLQAFVLHLLSVRDVEQPRTVWYLTGIAMRIAEVMGMEKDGTCIGLPPFETEIRRRLWWHLMSFDARAAELCGLVKFKDLNIGLGSTQGPYNINDDQLYSGMKEAPKELDGIGSSVFVVLKCELLSFAAARVAELRQRGTQPSQYENSLDVNKVDLLKAFAELEGHIESRYLRYCDPTQPLHLFTMLVCRMSMNVIRFRTNHPRKWLSIQSMPEAERKSIWDISIKLLEQQAMVDATPQLQRFAWQGAHFFQWHAFIFVLDVLRADPVGSDAEKAWQLVTDTYRYNPDMLYDTKKSMYVAVGNLCVKAYTAREVALRSRQLYVPPTPDFISTFRYQREKAKAKKGAKLSLALKPVDSSSQPKRENPSVTSALHLPRSNESTFVNREPLASNNRQQDADTTTKDIFWFVDDFNNGKIGDTNDIMELDMDFLMNENLGAQEEFVSTVDWDQWDTWLAQ